MSYGKFGMKCLFRTENSIGTTAGKVGNPESADFGHQCFFFSFFIFISFYGLVVLGVLDLNP
jgi:hypothetical protein